MTSPPAVLRAALMRFALPVLLAGVAILGQASAQTARLTITPADDEPAITRSVAPAASSRPTDGAPGQGVRLSLPGADRARTQARPADAAGARLALPVAASGEIAPTVDGQDVAPQAAAEPAIAPVPEEASQAVAPPPSDVAQAPAPAPAPAAPVNPATRASPPQANAANPAITRPQVQSEFAPINPHPPGMTPPAPPAPAARAPARSPSAETLPQPIPPTGSFVSLESSKGTLLRLPASASNVFIADPTIADVQVKSPSLVYVYGKKPGETVFYAVTDADRVIANMTVRVTHNLSSLRNQIRAVAGESPVTVNTVDSSLIIQGSVANPVQAEEIRRLSARFSADAESIINQLRVTQPNQINLRVRIAEVSRETLKQFGFNWDAVLTSGQILFGVATGNPVAAALPAATAGSFLTRRTSPNSQNTVNNVFGSFNGKNLDLNGLIDALGTEGLVTVLAEPNLTALSGETASFLAGGEFPIPVPQGQNTITIEFKKFGVGLAFTPTVLDGGRISMRVRPEVSQLTTTGSITLGGFNIPALTTRRAETTIELGSGQSFAIAGLLQNNTNQDISRTPFLGDLPVLGTLFRSDRFRRNETELVIIATPYMVRPVSARDLASPTDGLVPPNDFERIIGGQNYRRQLPNGGAVPRDRDGQGLVGPVGFMLE